MRNNQSSIAKVAVAALNMLAEMHSFLQKETEANEDFYTEYIRPMWAAVLASDDSLPNQLLDVIFQHAGREEVPMPRGAMMLSCAYALMAVKEESEDQGNAIWLCSQAQFWLGIARGFGSEPKLLKTEYFSEKGKAGAAVKNQKLDDLKAYAIAKDDTEKSANAVAHAIAQDVIDHGRKVGGRVLTEQNAQRTVAKWLNESRKRTT